MSQNGYEVLTVSAAGPDVQLLTEAEGVDHEAIPLTRRISPLLDLYCLVKLIILIRKFKPHIIHTHTPKAGLIGMFAGFLCRTPTRLHTVAGLPFLEAKKFTRAILFVSEVMTYLFAHRVYPNSFGLKKILASRFPMSGKMRVIGNGSSNGINCGHFSRSPELLTSAQNLKQRLGLQNEAIVFSYVGRIVKEKGIDELVAAFAELSKTIPCYLLLVGPFEQNLAGLSTKSLSEIGNNQAIRCLGFMNDVREAMLTSDVFVFPSYREGFPNVVLQAACLEIATIATDINGCNEIIKDKTSGRLIPPKNTSQLKQAMYELAINAEARKAYGSTARRTVVQRFNHEFVWRELLEEYKSFTNP